MVVSSWGEQKGISLLFVLIFFILQFGLLMNWTTSNGNIKIFPLSYERLPWEIGILTVGYLFFAFNKWLYNKLMKKKR